jgi:hypothetical protein
MNRRLWLPAAAVLGLALVLAFPLRPLVERTVIVPAAYILWLAGLLYESLPQIVWWAAVLLLAAWIVAGSLLPKETFSERKPPGPQPVQGPVESLAHWIRRTRGGTYYKWLVAHRLGKLAHQMLAQREGNRPRPMFSPLAGADWQPGPELQEYLETGLHGSFADFPGGRKLAGPAGRTPLDLEIAEAIEFLESKAEVIRG